MAVVIKAAVKRYANLLFFELAVPMIVEKHHVITVLECSGNPSIANAAGETVHSK